MTILLLLLAPILPLLLADNQCNPADIDIITKRDSFGEFAYDCGFRSLGSGRRTAKCVMEGCGVSEGCAHCYGTFTKCGRGCAMQCVIGGNPATPACQKCMDKTPCVDALSKCTGISELPPPPSRRNHQCN
ncbi:hypothetical protein FOZ63_015236 [Perkinsus olseni]|uniref:Immunoglobulin super DCC subclass member n=1 Tax=Perkinsus olseni TaxID=32597 RepID=A0A7J6TQ20_PEROL|nr:hypothetical protein FOZ62_013034 [Perkinsus olseni]KAF4746732.1 hypothetical protein FOZ63_015236 [Perkinsus olseni]